jgi:putative DNA primase/helicase
MSAVEHFRAAMRAAGLDHAGELIDDGKLHRFKAAGDRHRNSWYVLHAGPPGAGAFGCWKRSIKDTWCEKRSERYIDSEWRAVREAWQLADAERQRAEIERHAKARKTAAWILGHAKPVTAHAYATGKGIKVFGGVRKYRHNIVLPLCNANGELHSLQFIGADGDKLFLSGGHVVGTFFTLADKPDSSLVICEGYATGASIFEATGLATVCAMNCGNLLAVSKALREKFADNDAWTEGNPGLTKATESATATRAKLAMPQFKDAATKPTDFNDLHKLEGLDTVKTQIENATMPTESDTEAFDRLAKLPPADYDRCRDGEAKRLRIRAATLDAEIQKRRAKPGESLQGRAVDFPDTEPWMEPVNGAALLNEIALTLERFIVAPVSAIIAATLFVLHTYAFDLGEISPILFITGPTKRCGKSKFLAVLLRLVSKPFAASSATPAGIYRVIELHHPTLGIDEVDTFVRGDEQLRGLINSGHTRDAAFHLGCVARGDKEYEPRRWSTWTPKIFSGIGRLADTIEDRAIIIRMTRRRKDEPCERLRYGMKFEDVRRKAIRFVDDHAEAIRGNNPSVPGALHDRAADNWTPLLVLADLAGGDWPAKAREAALELSGGEGAEALGANAQLLTDIHQVFGESGTDRIASKDLCERLASIEGRPWAEFGKNQKPISPNQLANLLREFGISSRGVRIGDATPRGYYRDDFAAAFSCYMADNGKSKCNNATKAASISENSPFQSATPDPCCVLKTATLTNKDADCCSVAFQKAETGPAKVYV